MKQEHKDLVNECIRQMRLAVSSYGYDSPTHGKITRDKGGVTYWAGIRTDGSIFHNHNQACHYDLHGGFKAKGYYVEDEGGDETWVDSSEVSDAPPLFIVSRIMWENNQYRQFAPEVVDAFLRWLTIKGPYARVFAKKGGKTVRETGYLVARCDVPANLLAGALFASRALTEHYGYLVWVWWLLVQRGVHPSIAFYHAHNISAKDHDNVYIQHVDWHVALSGKYTNKETVLPFKNKKLVEVEGLYSTTCDFVSVHDAWGGPYRDDYWPDKLQEIKRLVQTGEEVEAVANPFLKMRVKEECDIHSFCDIWAKQLIEYYGDDNA